MIEIVVICGGAYLLYKAFVGSGTGPSASTSAPSAVRRVKPAGKIVTLVGRTGAGKSSTGNALLSRSEFEADAAHGTTTEIRESQHPDGYRVRDTPGLLDTPDYSWKVLPALEDSALVVYVASGQLLRPELEFVAKIASQQGSWNSQERSTTRRVCLFINFGDVRSNSMSRESRQREEEAIRQQVAEWIPSDMIAFGAAAPFSGEAAEEPEIGQLKHVIQNLVAA